MKTYTLDDIRRRKPCYDPVTGKNYKGETVRQTGLLPATWRGTLLDILAVEDCPAEDRMWTILQFLDENDLRLLACAMVRYSPLPDGRVVWDLLAEQSYRDAVEVAERYARGNATLEELSDARCAAPGINEPRWTPEGHAAALASVCASIQFTWEYAQVASSGIVALAGHGFNWTTKCAVEQGHTDIVRQFLAGRATDG